MKMQENEDLIIEDISLYEHQDDIQTIETVETIDVSDVEVYEIDSSEAFPSLGEGNENLQHQLLNGKELPDQHPITAITGLREELDDIESLNIVYSDIRGHANYYLWEDENILQENRVGYFVTIPNDINNIKICSEADEIFGVTIDVAGFIGGQDDIDRDYRYGLVITNGVVHVRCELSVNIGDYVISNGYGYAKKSDSGYKVVGRHKIDGVEYAEITLVTPIGKISEISNDMNKAKTRLSAAEKNVVAAMNLANEAYNKASEVNNVSEEAIKNALEALDKSTDVSEKTDRLETMVGVSNEIAVQAKAISESAAVSAENIRKEVTDKANEALAQNSELRRELEAKIAEADAELDNAVLELEATKESIESTKNEIQEKIDETAERLNETEDYLEDAKNSLQSQVNTTSERLDKTESDLEDAKNSLQSQVNQTLQNIEDLEEDLRPLSTWPNGSGVDRATALIGFVDKVDENSSTLASITKFEGEFGDSMATFIQEATKDNATVSAIAGYQKKDEDGNPYGPSGATILMGQVDANTASINLLTQLDGEGFSGLAGLVTQVNTNSSSIETLASHVVGEFENSDDWVEGGKDVNKVYYVKNRNLYYYYVEEDNKWHSTSKSYEAGLNGSVAGIHQTTDDNKARIDSIASWQGETDASIASIQEVANQYGASIENITEWQGTTNESIAQIIQNVNDNESNINSLVQWQNDTTQSIAQIEEKANANESNITLLTSWKSEVGRDVENIASIKTQSDANKSAIEGLTSWKGTASQSLSSVKQQSDDNKARIDSIASWQGETEESIAEVIQQADRNSASITSLTEWQGRTNNSIALIDQRVDSNESNISSLTTWQSSAQTSIANVEQKANSNESKINSLTSWQTAATESIANVEQKASDNESAIKSFTSWKDEANESITEVKQTANQNAADISLVTSWRSEIEDDVSSIASIKTTADENKASVEQLVKKDTELSTAIAAVETTADANSASIEQITSWKSNVDPTINSVAGIQQTADNNSAKIEGLTSWQGETNIAMARIEQKTDDNGASINSIISDVDKYSVGEYSQAYGLTYDQAKSILKEGMVYIPVNHPDGDNHTEEYDGQGQTNTFSEGWHYIWNGNDWDEYGGSVVFWGGNDVPVASGNLEYWYINSNEAPEGYEPYALYIWDTPENEDPRWTKVNILSGNVNNRLTSIIKQTADKIAIDISNTRESVASHQQWLDDNSANIQDIVGWKSDVKDNVSQIATIQQTANEAGASIAQVVESIGKDGKVNAASIVTAINNGDSSVVIDADHVDISGVNVSLKGETINLTADDIKIESTNFQVDANGNLSCQNADVSGIITANDGDIGGWEINETQITKTVGEYTTTLDSVTGSIVSNNISAAGGTIGGWTINQTEITQTYDDNIRRLPDEYTEVEWIESNGSNAYIDLGFQPTHTTGFEITFIPYNTMGGDGTSFGSIMGAREKASTRELQLTTYNDGTDYNGTLRFGNQNCKANLIKDRKITCSLRNGKYIDPYGSEKTLTGTFTSPCNLTVCALNNNGTITQYGKVRIFSLQIYNGETLNKNLIPAYRNSDKKIGLYDLQNGSFYPGAGTFTKGKSVPTTKTYTTTLNSTTGSITSNSINAQMGTIATWNLGSFTDNDATYSNSLYNDAGNYRVFLRSSSSDTSVAFGVKKYTDVNKTRSDYQFYVQNDGKLFAKNADIQGVVNATSGSFSRDITIGGRSISNWITEGGYINEIAAKTGSIGGWQINSTYLYSKLEQHPWAPTGYYGQIRLGPNTVEYGVTNDKDEAPTTFISTYWSYIITHTNNSISDRRLKKDIEDYSDDYERVFDLLRPVRYKYINGTSDRYHTGFIAQEVVNALEQSNLSTQDFAAVMLCNQGKDDEQWMLRRDEFVALNTWQIQKAKARIAELEEKVSQLEVLIKGE